ncbi:MAG: Phosphoenolpyruvate synthase [Planctomycetota bacterium]
MSDEPWIHRFWPGGSDTDPARVDLLGGKGAGLAALSRAGFPVPPGFTISSACCEYVERHGRWPEALAPQLRTAIADLEARVGRAFGAGSPPLLVAVRSGAAVSMPGMMDTILNCGLHPGLAPLIPTGMASANAAGADRAFATPDANRPSLALTEFWSSYAEHTRMFLASATGQAAPSTRVDETSEAYADRLRTEWHSRVGTPFPMDPWESLVTAINAVFRSWNSERALTYRRHHRVTGVRGTAVNVQSMFPAQRSGVLFTAHPQRPERREMLLEASWGLGEAVVSGAVTPDVYVLDSDSFHTLETIPGQRPAGEPALSGEQIAVLAELGRRVERHFGFPCDIEWGWRDSQPALLQARAIKGLELVAERTAARRSVLERLESLAIHGPVVLSLHNVAETVPFPQPLTADCLSRLLSARGGLGRLYRVLGFEPAETDASILEFVGGRPYAHPERLATLFFRGLPLGYDLDQLVADRATLDGPPQQLRWDDADPFLFLRLPRLLWILARASRRERQRCRDAVERFEQRVVQPIDRQLAAWQAIPWSDYSDRTLRDHWRECRELTLGEWAAESLLPGYLGGLAHARLDAALRTAMGPTDGAAWLARLVSGLDGDLTVAQNEMLERIASDGLSLAEFLARFGHRTAGEMELAQPRWREEPSYLERIVRPGRPSSARSPTVRHARQRADRLAAEADWLAALAIHGASSLYEDFLADLRTAQRLLPYRETGKHHWLRAYERLRAIALEYGRRSGLGDQVFLLRETELLGDDPIPDAATLAARQRRWKACRQLGLPDLLDSRNPPRDDASGSTALDNTHNSNNAGNSNDTNNAGNASHTAGQRQFAARPLSAGIVEGVARCIVDPREVEDLADDTILVCPSTDPGWTPLFARIRGLVVERGGQLSHGAIVARDFGIPAVACDDALRRIPEACRLRLDAVTGRVTLLEPRS